MILSLAYLTFLLANVPCEYSADDRQVKFRVHRKETVIPYERITEVQFFVAERRSLSRQYSQRGIYPEEHLRFICSDGAYEFRNALPVQHEGADPMAESKFMGLNTFILSRHSVLVRGK